MLTAPAERPRMWNVSVPGPAAAHDRQNCGAAELSEHQVDHVGGGGGDGGGNGGGG